MDKLHLENIQSVIDGAVENKIIAGLNVLICKDGQEQGYWESGFANIAEKKHFNRNTICRLYSQSKPVTAVAALILLEQGKIELDEPVGQFIPEFWNLQVCYEGGRNGKPQKANRPILIQDLLNMTSGYTYGAWWDGAPLGEHLTSDLIQELNKDVMESRQITTLEVAKRLAAIPVSFEPGTDYNYGLSADILGAVIEVVSGMKLSQFMKKYIFDPLGMKDTGFFVPAEKLDRLANVYKQTETGMELFEYPNLGIQPFMNKEPSFESGGAGLCSTIDDYLKFAQMLCNGGEYNGVRILKKATVDFMTNARLRPNLQKKFEEKMEHLSGYTYCNLCRVAIDSGRCKALTENGEFGWDGWLGPYVSIDLKNKLIMLVLMQRTDSGTTSTTRKIKNIVYSGL
ncbi:MAG: beta-lactamase family protein [Treponema sp.]|nr:beta-lactamase family protein [Treponema sp.]